jgi:hypothetical protein
VSGTLVETPEQVRRELEELRRDAGLEGAWTDLPMLTGWAPAGGYVAQYKRERNGFVSLRGRVTRVSGATLDMAQLPTGVRPAQFCTVPVIQNDAAGVLTMSLGTGILTLVGAYASYVSLDGVRFQAAAQ